jgi:hypothetical protein
MDTNEDNLKAAAKLIQNKTHRSSGHPVQITLGQQVAMEYLKKNPHLIDYYGNQEYEARENLPPKEDLVAYLKTQLTRKEAIKLTGEKKTLIDHWFRTDSGHSYPSIENWEKLKKGMKEIRYDKEMTETVSKEWTGLLLPTPTCSETINVPRKVVWKANSPRVQSNQGIEGQAKLVDLMHNQMLPTPIAGDWKGQLRSDGTASMLSGKASLGMLPTPTKSDYNSARTPEKYEQDKTKYAEQGVNLQMPLKQMARNGMLPTPTASDNMNLDPTTANRKANGEKRPSGAQIGSKLIMDKRITDQMTSSNSQLNPLFVEEMMGFPENWTLLPFLNGETNPSKPTETPSSHK